MRGGLPSACVPRCPCSGRTYFATEDNDPSFITDTNLLERTFVEVRRRTKIIGRFPGETSALSLIWAVLELASRGWRGITMTPKAVAEIKRLRRGRASAQPHVPAQPSTEEVIAA